MTAKQDEAQRAARNMPQWELNRKMFRAALIIIPILILLIYISFFMNPAKPKAEKSRQQTNSLQK
ncbi:MAG: hypothetical protein QG566_169 [Patescibacteria group bacterium]|jgi:hypothetical protein|nr:hypothetical protein [Patescibacteria group bacterium]